MKPIIAPSLLSADFSRLAEAIDMINQSEAAWLHLDIMDGHFVPNITFGMPVIRDIRKHTSKVLDVHLMISNPDTYLEAFRDAGADVLTVHYETCPHLHRTIGSIKDQGIQAGICLNPHTPVSLLENIIADVDMVLIMSVNPGFGGQKFIENTYDKVRQLSRLIAEKNPSCLIEVDGGVNYDTGKKLFDAGTHVLVAGSFIFAASDPAGTIKKLKEV